MRLWDSGSETVEWDFESDQMGIWWGRETVRVRQWNVKTMWMRQFEWDCETVEEIWVWVRQWEWDNETDLDQDVVLVLVIQAEMKTPVRPGAVRTLNFCRPLTLPAAQKQNWWSWRATKWKNSPRTHSHTHLRQVECFVSDCECVWLCELWRHCQTASVVVKGLKGLGFCPWWGGGVLCLTQVLRWTQMLVCEVLRGLGWDCRVPFILSGFLLRTKNFFLFFSWSLSGTERLGDVGSTYFISILSPLVIFLVSLRVAQ